MSRIYFHSPTEETEVRGPERALFGAFTSDALLAALHLHKDRRMLLDFERQDAWRIASLLRPAKEVQPEHLAVHLSVMTEDQDFDLGDGRTVGVFAASLNTLLANGSDPMVLAARLHGQCEIHCYVEGPNRAWLAEVIEQGRASGIFRGEMGWESVIEHLRRQDDEPAVTSYSVCDQFPNAGVAKEAGLWTPSPEHQGVWTPEDQPDHRHLWGQPWWDGDEWYDLDFEEQWRLSMEAIRAQPWLEMKPERWRWPEYHFGDPITGYHVAEAARKLGRDDHVAD